MLTTPIWPCRTSQRCFPRRTHPLPVAGQGWKWRDWQRSGTCNALLSLLFLVEGVGLLIARGCMPSSSTDVPFRPVEPVHPHALRLDSESPCRRRPSPLTAQTWLAASTPRPEGVLASAARAPRSAVRDPGRGITTDGRRPCLGSSGAYQTRRARTDQAQRPLSHPHTRTGELRGGESGRLGGQYRRDTKDCLVSEQEFRRLAAQRARSISQRRP